MKVQKGRADGYALFLLRSCSEIAQQHSKFLANFDSQSYQRTGGETPPLQLRFVFSFDLSLYQRCREGIDAITETIPLEIAIWVDDIGSLDWLWGEGGNCPTVPSKRGNSGSLW